MKKSQLVKIIKEEIRSLKKTSKSKIRRSLKENEWETDDWIIDNDDIDIVDIESDEFSTILNKIYKQIEKEGLKFSKKVEKMIVADGKKNFPGAKDQDILDAYKMGLKRNSYDDDIAWACTNF